MPISDAEREAIVATVVGARQKANVRAMLIGMDTAMELAVAAANIAALTENSGAIGGTNDGDIPSLAAPDDAKLTAAVREIAVKVNAIIAALVAAGLMDES